MRSLQTIPFFRKYKNQRKIKNNNYFITNNKNIIRERFNYIVKNYELCKVFDIEAIVVKISNGIISYTGHLYNISSEGVAVIVSSFPGKMFNCYLTFNLGKRFIGTEVVVSYLKIDKELNVIGLTFVNISADQKEYLKWSVYITRILHDNKMI